MTRNATGAIPIPEHVLAAIGLELRAHYDSNIEVECLPRHLADLLKKLRFRESQTAN